VPQSSSNPANAIHTAPSLHHRCQCSLSRCDRDTVTPKQIPPRSEGGYRICAICAMPEQPGSHEVDRLPEIFPLGFVLIDRACASPLGFYYCFTRLINSAWRLPIVAGTSSATSSQRATGKHSSTTLKCIFLLSVLHWCLIDLRLDLRTVVQSPSLRAMDPRLLVATCDERTRKGYPREKCHRGQCVLHSNSGFAGTSTISEF
jgi:hypothetical protein